METRKTTHTDPRDPADPRDPRDPWDGGFGYEPPPPPPRSRGLDFSALFVLLDAIRGAVPREVERQFTSLVREALLTLRSLIDWYLERLDRGRREPQVEDIPID
jgi:hypothetical protein